MTVSFSRLGRGCRKSDLAVATVNCPTVEYQRKPPTVAVASHSIHSWQRCNGNGAMRLNASDGEGRHGGHGVPLEPGMGPAIHWMIAGGMLGPTMDAPLPLKPPPTTPSLDLSPIPCSPCHASMAAPSPVLTGVLQFIHPDSAWLFQNGSTIIPSTPPKTSVAGYPAFP